MGLNTGDFIWVNTELNSSRTGNHGGNHRLCETCQCADNACSNTACRTNAGAAAELVAPKDDISHDNIQEASCLHDADEQQDTRHIGNHRVQTGINHLCNCHRSASG